MQRHSPLLANCGERMTTGNGNCCCRRYRCGELTTLLGNSNNNNGNNNNNNRDNNNRQVTVLQSRRMREPTTTTATSKSGDEAASCCKGKAIGVRCITGFNRAGVHRHRRTQSSNRYDPSDSHTRSRHYYYHHSNHQQQQQQQQQLNAHRKLMKRERSIGNRLMSSSRGRTNVASDQLKQEAVSETHQSPGRDRTQTVAAIDNSSQSILDTDNRCSGRKGACESYSDSGEGDNSSKKGNIDNISQQQRQQQQENNYIRGHRHCRPIMMAPMAAAAGEAETAAAAAAATAQRYTCAAAAANSLATKSGRMHFENNYSNDNGINNARQQHLTRQQRQQQTQIKQQQQTRRRTSFWSLAVAIVTMLACLTATSLSSSSSSTANAQVLGGSNNNKLLATTRKLSAGGSPSATGGLAARDAGAGNTGTGGSGNGGKLLVCYYTNWSQYRPKEGKYVPEDIDPHLCTHLIVAFGWMKKNKLTPFDASDESKDGKKGLYERVTSLKQANPNLKVLIAVGGWSFGTERFKSMAANRYNRQLFIFSALEFLRERNFDGLDIDWEFPRADDKKNFVDLLKELREAFDAEAKEKRLPKLLLTCAVSAGAETVRGGYDVAPIGMYTDFINIMSYDFHGKWESKTGHNAPLFASSGETEWRKQLSMDFGVKLWERMGAPKSKLVVGLSTYGRSFTLSNQQNHGMNAPTSGGGKAGEFTRESGFLAYYEICDMLKQGASYYWDEEQAVPYVVHGDQWVGFDDELSIRNKVKWLNEQGYAGAMVWALDMDDFKGTCTPKKYPLIRAMAEGLFNLPTRPSQEWRLIIEAARQRAAAGGATAAGGSTSAFAGNSLSGSAMAVPSLIKPQTSGLTPSELATVIVSSAGITNPATAEAIRTAIVALAGSALTQSSATTSPQTSPATAAAASTALATTAAAAATGGPALQQQQQVLAAGNELANTLRNIPGLNMTSLLSSPSAQAALASANPQLAAVLAAAAVAQNKSLDSTNARIVCYYTNWSYKRPGSGRFGPENLDPNLCTHIIYAFYGLKDSKLVPTEEIDNSDNEQAPYRRIVALKQLNPNLKVMLAVGGWMMGYAPFRQLTENAYRQTLFTFEVIDFLRKRQFDGLDLCWEFPRGLDDKEKFSNLVKELRDSFEGEAKSSGKPRLLLSAAVPASFEAIAAGYDVPTINKYLDFMNVMTYDFHGDWEQVVGHNSPLFPLNSATAYQKKLTLDFSASEWVRQGASKENLVIGLPTYGRTFTLSNPNLTDIDAPAARGGKPGAYTKESGFLSFFEVCDMLKNQATLVWDNEQMIPYAYKGDQWVGFDDPRSFKMKVQWLKQNGYSGIMIWSVDMDDFAGTCMGLRYPLIKSAKEELKGYYVPNLIETAQGSSLFPSINGLKDKDELLCEEADGHITYHKDKKDCTHYYMCEGSRKHHMPCPQNLVFNVNENVCDWPENVEGCGTKATAATAA